MFHRTCNHNGTRVFYEDDHFKITPWGTRYGRGFWPHEVDLFIGIGEQVPQEYITPIRGRSSIIETFYDVAPTPEYVHIPCPDGGVPVLSIEQWYRLFNLIARKAFEKKEKTGTKYRIVPFCIGSHGRTGLFLTIFTYSFQIDAENPLSYVRENHCPHAVETREQIAYLRALGIPVPNDMVGSYEQTVYSPSTWEHTLKRDDIDLGCVAPFKPTEQAEPGYCSFCGTHICSVCTPFAQHCVVCAKEGCIETEVIDYYLDDLGTLSNCQIAESIPAVVDALDEKRAKYQGEWAAIVHIVAACAGVEKAIERAVTLGLPKSDATALKDEIEQYQSAVTNVLAEKRP